MNTRQNAHRFHADSATDVRGLPWHVMPVLTIAAALAALFGGTVEDAASVARATAMDQAGYASVAVALVASPQPGEGEAELVVAHQQQSY